MATHATPTPGARYPDLTGRRVFITGGGSGIGAELVRAFCRQGARVAFIDLDARASESLALELRRDGVADLWWRQVDVRDVEMLCAAVRDARQAIGLFNVLVNNVASDDRHTLEDVSTMYYDDRIAINQRSAFFAIQALLPDLRGNGGGSIVNLGSTGWLNKATGYPCYAIAKSSFNGLTRSLARELGADRIRINTVSPGWVMTQRQKELWLDAEGEAAIARNQCLPDRLQPSDVADMVVFLASDQSRMCTAQEFIVDGGWS